MWTLRHVCSTYLCPCDSNVQCTCYYNYVFTGCVSGLLNYKYVRISMLYTTAMYIHVRFHYYLGIHIEHKERYNIFKLFAVWSLVSIYDIPYYVGYCQMGYEVFNSRVQKLAKFAQKIDKYQFMVSEILFYLE